MIPKIIHQVWLGICEIRGDHWQYMKKWKLMYPDFEYKLWTDREVKEIVPPEKHKYFFHWQWPVAMQADIYRYEIVRKFGGLYIDVDFEPLKRIDDLMLNCKFFGGIQPNDQTAIGIFGADPENELLMDVCHSIVSNIETKLAGGCQLDWVDQLTGPEFFNRISLPYRQDPLYHFYEPKFFYPYSWKEPARRKEEFRITCPDAYAVHHWTKNWI